MKIFMKKIFCLRISLIIFIVISIGSSIAMCGFEKPAYDKAKSKDNLYQQVELFADAVSILRSDYVEDTDSKKLIYGAMKGMLSSLDDYSEFMEPDEYNEIRVETKGEFGGLGIEVTLKDNMLTIITPLSGSPAELAGVRAGDKIVKIDGKVTKDMSLNDAVKLMRGKPGTAVNLTVWRDGPVNIIDIPIKRAIIQVHSIKKAELIDGKIGYIKLVEFQDNTSRDLGEAMKKLKGQGMSALILDLRNNPGGLFDAAINVSEFFLPKDSVIVSIKAKEESGNAEFRSGAGMAKTDIPLVVIVNEGSASAAEIVAGAIKDNKRGIILGRKTFGKASVQTVIPLKDGSAIRFTTAYYSTPSGKIIKDEGIIPDVVVESGAQPVKDSEYDAIKIFEKVEEGKGLEKYPVIEKDKPLVNTESKKEDKAVISEGSQVDKQLQEAINLIKAMKVNSSDRK